MTDLTKIEKPFVFLDADRLSAAGPWHIAEGETILLYTLKPHQFDRHRVIQVNDLMIRIENANGSKHDLKSIADRILAALTGNSHE